MKQSRSQLALVGVIGALTFLLGVVLSITPAYAEALHVSGADYLYVDGTESSSVDILTVTGQKGDTVYINMSKGDQVLASHLPFTLDDENAKVDANGDMVGVASVSFAADNFSHDDTYAVEVFSDRQEANKLYAGTVSTLFAQYEDVNKQEPLVVRTLASNESRPFTTPEARTFNGATYKLKAPEPQEIGGKTCYVYTPSADAAESIEAHVTYYDEANTTTPLKTDTFTLTKGQSQQAEVPAVISDASGALYRTLQLAGTVTLAYPGVSEYNIMCKKLNADWGKVGSFYTATIKYVDTAGNQLGVVDSVIVNKRYTYTAPDKIYVNDDGTVKQYQILSKDQAVLQLEPGDAEGAQTYEIVYDLVSDDAPRTWTVVLENGSVSPKDAKRVIKRIDYTGKPGETTTHTTEQKITVDGVDYVPATAAQASYEHLFSTADMEVEQHIYYVPDGYVAPEAYEVAVKYVNIATNETIDSQSYTVSPSMRSDLEIVTPESFSAEGIEWIRLRGQEMAIRHSFYSPIREYVVYYRDVNDDLHESTVIRNVRVVYVDGAGNTVSRPTTVTNNGTTDNGTTDAGTTDGGTTYVGTTDGGTTDGGTTYVGTTDGGTTGTGAATAGGAGTTAGAADAGAPTDTGLATGANLLAVDGADGATVVNEGGQDLATTRIEDDVNPLAGPTASDGAAKLPKEAVFALGGVAAAAVAGLVLFFIFKRRKQAKNESSDDDLTA